MKLLIFIASLSLVLAYTLDGKTKPYGSQKVSKPDCMKATDGLGCACPVCKDVVYYTRMMILDHVPSEEQVLDKVCDRVFAHDSQKRDFCEQIIHVELPQIIDYVKNRVDPNKCCSKFC